MSRYLTPILAVPKVVFFPNASLPFYIADPNYLRMIQDALESGTPITVSLAVPLSRLPNGHTQYVPREIATVGKPLLLETGPEGGVKILMRGISRVRILRVVQHLPYLIAEVDTMPDREEAIVCENKIERLHALFKNWIGQSLINPQEKDFFLNQTSSIQEVLDYLSMFLVQDYEVKQLLLECDSPLERIHMLDALLIGNKYYLENPQGAAAIKYFEIIDKISKTAC